MAAEAVCAVCGTRILANHLMSTGKLAAFEFRFKSGGTGWEFTPNGAEHRKGAPERVHIYQAHTCRKGKRC